MAPTEAQAEAELDRQLVREYPAIHHITTETQMAELIDWFMTCTEGEPKTC